MPVDGLSRDTVSTHVGATVQLLHKIRRTLVVVHVHNKYLTIPGHNHHVVMIVNHILNTLDNKAVASKTL